MTTVRLHIDGQGAGWAMVRCDRCQEMQRYPVATAARGPVTCECGHVLDVRENVDAEVQVRTHKDLNSESASAD